MSSLTELTVCRFHCFARPVLSWVPPTGWRYPSENEAGPPCARWSCGKVLRARRAAEASRTTEPTCTLRWLPLSGCGLSDTTPALCLQVLPQFVFSDTKSVRVAVFTPSSHAQRCQLHPSCSSLLRGQSAIPCCVPGMQSPPPVIANVSFLFLLSHSSRTSSRRWWPCCAGLKCQRR